MDERTCVVLAGGLGLRLREVTGGLLPKVLAPVNGEPFLAHKLRSLADMGVKNVVLLTGELGDQVETYIRGRDFGLRVSCLADGPSLLGTGGAIARAIPQLPRRFWVTYGDSLMTTDLAAAERRREEAGLAAIVTVFRHRDQLQPSNMAVEGELLVRYSKSERDHRFEWIDLGLLNFSADVFRSIPTDRATDLVEVLMPLIEQRLVLAWSESRRFWDIGTPDALRATEQWLHQRSG